MNKSDKEKALQRITKGIANCIICQENKTGVAVPGEGDADADVVFVGEAPGKQEAKTGRPFIGPAGKLLRTLIADAGLKESDVFITSAVKYLPEHVTPTPEEVGHGRTHLFAQLDVINPKVVVLLGRVAALAVLDRNISVSKEHGTIIEEEGRKYLLAYHPAAPLYSPKVKSELIGDFKKLRSIIRSKV